MGARQGVESPPFLHTPFGYVEFQTNRNISKGSRVSPAESYQGDRERQASACRQLVTLDCRKRRVQEPTWRLSPCGQSPLFWLLAWMKSGEGGLRVPTPPALTPRRANQMEPHSQPPPLACSRQAAARDCFTSAIRSWRTFFASPKSINVLDRSKSSFLIPAYPTPRLRFTTKTVRAW